VLAPHIQVPIETKTTTAVKDFFGYKHLDKFAAGEWWWYVL
jgi:hypothetical protein